MCVAPEQLLRTAHYGGDGFKPVARTLAPPPLEGGGWGEGCASPGYAEVRTPPPAPSLKGRGFLAYFAYFAYLANLANLAFWPTP